MLPHVLSQSYHLFRDDWLLVQESRHRFEFLIRLPLLQFNDDALSKGSPPSKGHQDPASNGNPVCHGRGNKIPIIFIHGERDILHGDAGDETRGHIRDT